MLLSFSESLRLLVVLGQNLTSYLLVSLAKTWGFVGVFFPLKRKTLVSSVVLQDEYWLYSLEKSLLLQLHFNLLPGLALNQQHAHFHLKLNKPEPLSYHQLSHSAQQQEPDVAGTHTTSDTHLPALLTSIGEREQRGREKAVAMR